MAAAQTGKPEIVACYLREVRTRILETKRNESALADAATAETRKQ
jgi:hypothetical protein